MSEPGSIAVAANKAAAPIVPQSTDDINKIAKFMVDAGALPRSYNNDGRKAAIAIMKGLEIGWLPMQSVQNMYVINGVPTLFGDGAMALARASGKMDYCKEWIGGEGDDQIAYCEVKRKGEAEPVIRSFSKAQAAKAGLLGKSGPWQSYPERMLQMRARAYAIRDAFADALMGLRIKEEVEDHEREEAPAPTVNPFSNKVEAIDVEVEDTRARGPDGEVLTDEQLEAMQVDNMAAATDPKAPFADPETALEAMRSSLETFNTAKDVDEYVAIWADMVTESAIDASVITTGRRMAATRKAQWSKAKA